MTYDGLIFKILQESPSYMEDSEYIINAIVSILNERKNANRNKIIINTNLRRGLPLENINKIAGPMIEAWAYEVFADVSLSNDNNYNLVNVEAQERLGMSDIILQFSKKDNILTGNIDVKATSNDIPNSGKSPNITSYSRIRTAYIIDPDFVFIVLSIKHKVYSQKNTKTNLIDGIMEIVDFNAYDFKFLSDEDISYNPALGTGQIQVKDIHYVSYKYRTTWEMCQLLDKKYLHSSRRNFDDFYREAKKKQMDKKLEIICGDSIEEMKKIETGSVDLIVTDPPYNLNKNYGNTKDNLEFNEYLNFTRKWVSEAVRVLSDKGTIYIFMGMRFISYLYMILEQEQGLHFNSWITWFYTQGIGKTKGFSPRHDDILMFTKTEKDFTFNLDNVRVPQKYYRSVNNMRGANPGNVWEFSHVHYCNKNRKMHPTQKPEALFERMILASSNEDDTVLDPFSGSGTLLRVCQQSNRNGIGIEINPDYVQMTKERLSENFTGFDSIDDRLLRIPNDLNDEKIRREYMNNHVNWFLHNNKNFQNELFSANVL